MKITFTLLCSLFFISNAFAYGESRLTLSIAGRSEFELVFDNKTYTSADNAFIFENVGPGNHTIRIYRVRENSRGRHRTSGDLFYAATIYVKQGFHTDVMINRFGKGLVDEQAMILIPRGSGRNAAILSESEFREMTARIESHWYGKLNYAMNEIRGRFFNTSQARELVTIMKTDADRLELSKAIYLNVIDRENFYQLYSLLSRESRITLQRYIEGLR